MFPRNPFSPALQQAGSCSFYWDGPESGGNDLFLRSSVTTSQTGTKACLSPALGPKEALQTPLSEILILWNIWGITWNVYRTPSIVSGEEAGNGKRDLNKIIYIFICDRIYKQGQWGKYKLPFIFPSPKHPYYHFLPSFFSGQYTVSFDTSCFIFCSFMEFMPIIYFYNNICNGCMEFHHVNVLQFLQPFIYVVFNALQAAESIPVAYLCTYP